MSHIFKIALSMVVLAGALISTLPAEADHGNNRQSINRRQTRQQSRIIHGVKSDSLTKKETARLSVAQTRLAAQEARMRASGNGLTRRERAALDNQQDSLSKNIYKQKHDDQTRQ